VWRRAVGAAPSLPLPLLPAAAAAPRQDSRAAEGRRRGEAPRIIHSSSLSLVATGLAILRPPPRHGTTRHGTARLFRFFLFSRAGGAAALADRSRKAPRLPSCGRFSGRRRRRRRRPSGRGRHATRSAGAGAPPFFLQPFSFPSLAARAGAGAPISATSAAPACPSAMRHEISFQGTICAPSNHPGAIFVLPGRRRPFTAGEIKHGRATSRSYSREVCPLHLSGMARGVAGRATAGTSHGRRWCTVESG